MSLYDYFRRVFRDFRESLYKAEPCPVIWLSQGPVKADDFLTLIQEAPEKRSPLIWHQRFENIFEKSRLTKNINKAVFTLTDPIGSFHLDIGFGFRKTRQIAFPTADHCATAAEETKEKLIMKIVLTHTEEFPFDCYEGNLANGEYAGAYLVKFKDCAHPELMFVTESQEFEDCCALENGSNIVERD